MDKFTFYFTVSYGEIRPYMPDVPVLLTASSFSRNNLKPPNLPDHITRRAADSGGFVATFKWGDYRYTPEQYVAWLYTWNPQWAATMDYCCEPEVVGKTGIVQERQQKTTDMAWYFWENFRDCPWCWVPTIQGWDVEDYIRHTYEMKPLIQAMQVYYGEQSEFRVGIGTLCKRASVSMINEVIHAVSDILPGIPLHLWGVKLGMLQSPLAIPEQVVSMDSAAWNGMWGTGRNLWKNTGMTQRQWCIEVALPNYQKKIETALSFPKQSTMF